MIAFSHPRVVVYDPTHLAATCDFADRTGQRAQLDRCLNDLAAWTHEDSYIHLYPDFVPMSFYFEQYPTADPSDRNRATRIMNGGVIYHGSLEDGSRPQTFSVTLIPCSSWSIHT